MTFKKYLLSKIKPKVQELPKCNCNIPMPKIKHNIEYKVISGDSVTSFNQELEYESLHGWKIFKDHNIKFPKDDNIYCVLERKIENEKT